MIEVWVFHGNSGRHTSGVFSTRTLAEDWILHHRLSGVLTAYPPDRGVYDWAVRRGTFRARRDGHHSPAFIGPFSSAVQDHAHHEDGVRVAGCE
ncbi:DUF7710 domain-containing protein [Deinococcus metalli]